LAGYLGFDLDSAELRLVELNPSAAGYSSARGTGAAPTGRSTPLPCSQLKERLKSGLQSQLVVIALPTTP